MSAIIMHPIGYIKSPYKERDEAPAQGSEDCDTLGMIVLDKQFIEATAGMKPGLKYIVLFHFHKINEYKLTVRARSTGMLTGLFSTRSPKRPNAIGVSIITIRSINNEVIEFTGVDMLDGTPVLDIKPYRGASKLIIRSKRNGH